MRLDARRDTGVEHDCHVMEGKEGKQLGQGVFLLPLHLKAAESLQWRNKHSGCLWLDSDCVDCCDN